MTYRKVNKTPCKATRKNPVSTGATIKKKQVVGKIGYCDNATLGIVDKYGNLMKGGHYVYIREMNGTTKCNVNVVTSLESKDGYFDNFKLGKVKRGYLYPIPKPDADFKQWSAINLDGNINGIAVSKIKNIGSVKMRKRHRFFVGKFTKKK